MVRVRHAVAVRKRRRKVLKWAKGFVGGRRKLYRTAKETLRHSWAYAFRDRKAKKRSFRNLWILRINAACREEGVPYSKFMGGLKKAKVALDRKSLADIAIKDRATFKKLVQVAADHSAK